MRQNEGMAKGRMNGRRACKEGEGTTSRKMCRRKDAQRRIKKRRVRKGEAIVVIVVIFSCSCHCGRGALQIVPSEETGGAGLQAICRDTLWFKGAVHGGWLEV